MLPECTSWHCLASLVSLEANGALYSASKILYRLSLLDQDDQILASFSCVYGLQLFLGPSMQTQEKSFAKIYPSCQSSHLVFTGNTFS